MKKLLSVVLMLFFVIVVYITPSSYALDCPAPDFPHIEYENYDAVIVGTVEHIKKSNTNKTVTVNVEKSFKGVVHTSIIVTEDTNWGISEVDGTYLYFLMKEENSWLNRLCAPTTSDLSLVNHYLADKVELSLIEHKDYEALKQSSTLFLIMLAVILLVVTYIAIRIILLLKKRR